MSSVSKPRIGTLHKQITTYRHFGAPTAPKKAKQSFAALRSPGTTRTVIYSPKEQCFIGGEITNKESVKKSMTEGFNEYDVPNLIVYSFDEAYLFVNHCDAYDHLIKYYEFYKFHNANYKFELVQYTYMADQSNTGVNNVENYLSEIENELKYSQANYESEEDTNRIEFLIAELIEHEKKNGITHESMASAIQLMVHEIGASQSHGRGNSLQINIIKRYLKRVREKMQQNRRYDTYI